MKKCTQVLVGSVVVAFLLFAPSAQTGGTNGDPRHHLPAADDEEEGYCAPYNGKICKSFIVSPRSVW